MGSEGLLRFAAKPKAMPAVGELAVEGHAALEVCLCQASRPPPPVPPPFQLESQP